MKGQKLKEFKGTEVVDRGKVMSKKLCRLRGGFEGPVEMSEMNL